MKLHAVLSLIRDSVSSVVFPDVCYFCGSIKDSKESVICAECRDSIRSVPMPFCSVCGLPLPALENSASDFCGSCLSHPPVYDKARYGVYYEQQAREAITKFKFNASLFNVRPITELLIEAFNRHYADDKLDAILPIPVHQRRLINRGFNQVVTLAKKLSDATSIPLDRTTLVKIRNTDPQVGLPRSKRIMNLKNVFRISCPEKIANRRILIIDDVSTTGTTVSEAAKTVKKAGADFVAILVLALRSKKGG